MLKSILLFVTVWSLIAILPIYLTWNSTYEQVFPVGWYNTAPHDFWNDNNRPSPLGLSLGIIAVIIGQFATLCYFLLWKNGFFGELTPIQKEGVPKYDQKIELIHHLAQPEGFVMLGGYLIFTWMLGMLPSSYYSFSGGINWIHVFLQLLIQDFIQFIMHYLEHTVSPDFYKISHKPHHRFTNPKLFDAFNGSVFDTFFMILVPLFITAHIIPANVWSYMTFGTLYANWLTLIHAEYKHSWDSVFRFFGFGTSADHHVHHKVFKYNYGHLFMYWDKVFGTYQDPQSVQLFNKGV